MVCFDIWDSSIIPLIEAPIQLGPDDELYCGRAIIKMLFKRHCSCSSFVTAKRTRDRKN